MSRYSRAAAVAALTGLAVAATMAPTARADDHEIADACTWVSTDEAASFLDGPVAAVPIRTRLPELSCAYRALDEPPGGRGLESDVRFAGAFARDAATTFRQVAEWPTATDVDGVGLKAVCSYELNVTPPSTTLTVLLTGERIYRVTGSYVWRCETLKAFAELAIARIGR
ncbi:hypothetical protein [Mycolicibacterium sp. HS_4_1]